MSPDEKNIWVEKSNDIKRQLQEYNETLAAYGIDKDGNKNSELHKVKKGIQLPKGPRCVYRVCFCINSKHVFFFSDRLTPCFISVLASSCMKQDLNYLLKNILQFAQRFGAICQKAKKHCGKRTL